jgi:hypothetical protein
MTKIVELNEIEQEQVAAGIGESTETDPQTGETIVRDCTGREIGRYMGMISG